MRFWIPLVATCLPMLLQAQPPAQPNLEAQKAAMRKLGFLTGQWSGTASVQTGPGKPVELRQTEAIEFRLDGLLLVIEGTGRDETGKVVFNALGVVSCDDAKSGYDFRAYNGGRKVDATFESDGTGFTWSFTSGPAQIRNVMKLTEKGEWSETTTVKLASGQEYTTVRMLLQKAK